MSTNSKKVKTVLFVCVENACRSQLAEAISNHFYPNRLHAFSAGSKPSTKINPKAIHSLKDLGIVHKGETKSIVQAEGINYDYIVINDNLEDCFLKIQKLIDAEVNNGSRDYDRDFIKNHIEKLTS